MLGGCAPQPHPSPSASSSSSPTFSTEAEAFAAAERTYRAYVDALNEVDLSDPDTFEPVFALTTGDALEASKQTFMQMHTDGWTVSGTTRIDLLDPFDEMDVPGLDRLTLDVCLNVSDVRLTDRGGESVVSPDRMDVQAMRLTLVLSSTRGSYLISSIAGRTDGKSCAV